MYFNAAQTQGAIGATIPAGPGASRHLNEQQFPGKPKMPGEAADGAAAEGAAGAGEAAAGAGAAEGAAELLPLLALA